MGYFSNGTEGADYQETWCKRCVHDDPETGRLCPIWGLHLEWNPHEPGDRDHALQQFIQRIGPWNGACTMFVAREEEWRGREDELREIWNEKRRKKWEGRG